MLVTFVSDYQDNDALRGSFNELAQLVFGIDFEKWYRHGYWDDRYRCYSLAEGDRIVANVSANFMELVVGGRRRKGLQLGTVMTHPDYRGRGLARTLMERVLEEHQSGAELTFLFAGDNSRHFYPRFGFEARGEMEFHSEVYLEPAVEPGSRRLNPSAPGDRRKLERLARSRRPVSKVFGVLNGDGILMWYCLNVFGDALHYLEEQDALIIARQRGEVLQLLDIVSSGDVDLLRALPHVLKQPITRVVYHFAPDRYELPTQSTPLNDEDSVFFVQPGSVLPSVPFRFPATAHA